MSSQKGSLSIIGSGCWHQIGTWGNRSCETLEKLSICTSCPVYISAGNEILSRELDYDTLESNTQNIENYQVISGNSHLIVKLANNWLALPVSSIKQISPATYIHKVAGARIDTGMVTVDGQIYLYVSGRSLFKYSDPNIENQQIGKSMFILTEIAGEVTVFDVDYIDTIAQISTETILKPPFTLSAEQSQWIKGIYKHNKNIVSVIDTEAVISSLSERL